MDRAGRVSLDSVSVTAGLARVRNRIATAGGDPDRVTVVAVTKGFGPEAPRAALEAGIVHLGENYAQELVAKAAVIGEEAAPVWHFIGGLQRNKVRLLAPHVGLWETIDRVSLGAEVAKRAPGAAVLVQVNISGEAAKSGCLPADAADLVATLRDQGLAVRGLMGVAAAGDLDRARAQFGGLAELALDARLAEHAAVHVQPRGAAGREDAGALDMDRELLHGRPQAGRDHVDGKLGARLGEGRFPGQRCEQHGKNEPESSARGRVHSISLPGYWYVATMSDTARSSCLAVAHWRTTLQKVA